MFSLDHVILSSKQLKVSAYTVLHEHVSQKRACLPCRAFRQRCPLLISLYDGGNSINFRWPLAIN
jgi:hypothetical protein